LRENVTISYRGKGYEIGRGEHFYGIWRLGAPQPEPVEWWPDTPEGWSGAWSRFTSVEAPSSIVPAGQEAAGAPGASQRAVLAAVALLGAGIVLGIAGLFPAYLGGSSLASSAADLVPHLIYLAGWAASAVLIFRGGRRMRAGALLGLGVSAVTFGLFFADAGEAIADGAHVMGAGLVLALAGWLVCAAGSVLAFRLRPAGAPMGTPAKPRGDEVGPVVMLMLAALGAAIAFAPSWDSYVLRTTSGGSESITAGNAFANPAPMIVGDVVVMVALVAVVVLAALWRPIRYGAALLAGAIIPMAAQAISALIAVGETTSPALFGISPAQAAAAGLTIDNGLTPVFWIFCAFVVAMIASCAWMLMTPHGAVPEPPRPSHPSAGQPGQPAPAWPAFGQPAPEPKPLTPPAHESDTPAPASTPPQDAAATQGQSAVATPEPGAAPAHTGPTPDTGTPTP
jgi:hypothetical protein